MGATDRVEAEGLRRLDADQAVARHGFAESPARQACRRRAARGPRRRARRARRAAGRSPRAGRKGRAASWISTRSASRERRQPVRAPIAAASRRRGPGRGGGGRRPRRDRPPPGPRRSPPGPRRSRGWRELVDRMGEQRPCRRCVRYCLGTSPPARLPLPAATSKATVVPSRHRALAEANLARQRPSTLSRAAPCPA